MGTVFSLYMSNVSAADFNFFNLLGTAFILSISNLSISNFELVKLGFFADDNVSTYVAYLYQILLLSQIFIISFNMHFINFLKHFFNCNSNPIGLPFAVFVHLLFL